MMASIAEQSCAATPRTGTYHAIDPLRVYRAVMEEDLLDEHGQLLDWLISFGFDTLDALCLDIQVVDVGLLPPVSR